MLNLFTREWDRNRDRLTRRDVLKIGALGIGGLSLTDLLRAEATADARTRGKSIININLYGGPSHTDMFDLKPDAPAEFRGEFKPIATNVPGMEICELMPRLAQIAGKFAVIRSVGGWVNEHKFNQPDSGWDSESLASVGGRPGIGAVMSKLFGPAQGAAPTFVELQRWTNSGYLGPLHSAYRPDGSGRSNLLLNRDVSMERLQERRQLRDGFDGLRREVDSTSADALDSFAQRAVNLITSGAVADALDLQKEDPAVRARYGGALTNYFGATATNQSFLVASRLVEAGVRCVSLLWRGWDTHVRGFTTLRTRLPAFDQALSALIEDLDSRGRLQDTIIMVSGEFGRTPRINRSAGRDHWPQVGFVLLAGGGFETGQVIGATNRLGETALRRPLHLQQVFATLYHQLGIDVNTVTLEDPNGRPQYLVNQRELIHELL